MAVSLTTGLVLVGCDHPTAQPPKPKFGSWGVDMSGMDRSLRPGNDFFDSVEG
ncbi:MAG: putative endopeptidase, partial [Mycobacterium sp.]|nr:putative endopeptidase [Mycobacterium sp.]